MFKKMNHNIKKYWVIWGGFLVGILVLLIIIFVYQASAQNSNIATEKTNKSSSFADTWKPPTSNTNNCKYNNYNSESIISLINEYRAEKGSGQLIENKILTQYAYTISLEKPATNESYKNSVNYNFTNWQNKNINISNRISYTKGHTFWKDANFGFYTTPCSIINVLKQSDSINTLLVNGDYDTIGVGVNEKFIFVMVAKISNYNSNKSTPKKPSNPAPTYTPPTQENNRSDCLNEKRRLESEAYAAYRDYTKELYNNHIQTTQSIQQRMDVACGQVSLFQSACGIAKQKLDDENTRYEESLLFYENSYDEKKNLYSTWCD